MSDEMDEETEGSPEDDFVDGEDFEGEPDEEADADPDLAEDIELDETLEDFADDGDDAVAVDTAATDGDKKAADETDDDEEESQPRARKVTDDEEDDDDEDDDDVEADLEAILRDRMAAADDEEDDEGDEPGEGPKADGQSGPRNDEFVCDSCFLLVNRSQFGSAKDPRCPMGDTECPSIVKIFGS